MSSGRVNHPPSLVLWTAPLTSFSPLMWELFDSVVWLLKLHERTSTSIANIHEQIPCLDPFQWTKLNHLSPALSVHHSSVCDRIPKGWETTVLIHILHVFWRGLRHAHPQCSSKHSSYPRYNVCGEWAQFCWTQMPSVIWVALGYLRNPKGTVTHKIYIYALPETQVIVKGKPEVNQSTLGCLRWCWTKGSKH